MSTEIDTDDTNNVVCPYCGEEHEIDIDYDADTNEITCYKCDREFCFEPDFHVTFRSWSMEKELEHRIKSEERTLQFHQEQGNAQGVEVYTKYLDRKRERLAKLKQEFPS